MTRCKYCRQEIIWINNIPFDDSEGSVKHKCQDWQKIHSNKLLDTDKINATYIIVLKLFKEIKELQQLHQKLLKEIKEKNV